MVPAKTSSSFGAGGMSLLQASVQYLLKEMVIPIPVSFVVQRHDKQVRLFQAYQYSKCVSLPCDGLAERSTHTVKDSSLHQKGLHIVRLAILHLFQQVTYDMAVTA